ncbi:MAG: hypothetical protein IJ574_02045 [Bacilli bacterium]|nr:hypothetical protein [Bacilli bacterium]
MKNNKVKYYILTVLLLAIVVLSSTYAYWTTTQTQEDENVVGTTCLSLEFKDTVVGKTGVKLSSTYPISDEEGMNLEGYEFTLTNRCDGYIAYTVNLESLINNDRLQLSSINAVLDDEPVELLSNYNNGIQILANTVADDAKALTSGVLSPVGSEGYTITYKLRLWIDKYAPTSEMNKSYSGKITISGENANEKSYPLYEMGDINKDGEVNSDDSSILSGIIASPSSASTSQKSLADVNADGVINSNDSTAVENYISGSSSSLYKKGDVNNDGVVDRSDVYVLRKNLTTANPLIKVLGDIDLDGVLSTSDVIYLERALATTSSSTPGMSLPAIATDYVMSLKTAGDTSLIDDGTTDHNVRYVGANPNNYVSFNGELWRIIGVMNNVAGGTTSVAGHSRLKIAKADLLLNYAYSATQATGYNYNNWEHSSTNAYLNGADYYGNLSDKNLIDTATYYLGGYSTKSKYDSYYSNMLPPEWYVAERNTSYVYEGNPGSWTGNIALMYPSDYGYASTGVVYETACVERDIAHWSQECRDEDWLGNADHSQWTITPSRIDGTAAAFIYDDSNLSSKTAYYSWNIRPVLYLDSEVKIDGGEGTSLKPYTLSK